MKKNKRLIYIIIASSVIGLSIIGATYAYFTASGLSSEASSLSVSFESFDEVDCSTTDLTLTVNGSQMSSNKSASEGTIANSSTSSITCNSIKHSTGSTVCTMDIIYTPTRVFTKSANNTNNDKELTLTGNGTSSVGAVSKAKYAETDMSNLNGKTTLVSGLKWVYNADAQMTYEFTTNFYNYDFNQNSVANQTYGGTLSVENISCMAVTPASTTLGETAVMDNQSSTYVSNTNGVQFNEISSDNNGKGLYTLSSTANDNYPVYYYRGEVSNNNVLFGEYCWKIVRTTSTGGVKLIYNGSPSNGKCTNTTGTATQLQTSAFNSTYKSLSRSGYMFGESYYTTYKAMASDTTKYVYGKDVSYSNGAYTLTTTKTGSGSWATDKDGLTNSHYTCWTTGTTCSEVYYINYTNADNAYYTPMTGGKKITDLVSEMVTNSEDTNSSTIKGVLDNWYVEKMTSYAGQIEDSQYCNDRSIYTLHGWSPTGSMGSLIYYPYRRTTGTYAPSLSCDNKDAFTTSSGNGNGKLDYPIALLTVDEIMLAGGKWGSSNTNDKFYLYTGQVWWSLSPASFYGFYAYVVYVTSSGYVDSDYVRSDLGVRPSISLGPWTEIKSGNGTSDTPYVIG